MSDCSGLDTDVIESKFLIRLNCSSNGLDTVFSTSSGAAPEYSVRTVNVGYEMSGINSQLNLFRLTSPKTAIPMTIMRIATGFLVVNANFDFISIFLVYSL